MPDWIAASIAGLAAGLVASFAMNRFQRRAAALFAIPKNGADPSTVKAADTASAFATGHPVTQKRRHAAGELVHYGLGALLGLGYALVVAVWSPAAWGFGAGFGIATALIVDDLLVPAFGWGGWVWRTPVNVNLYSLVSHIVFGIVTEGVRRLALLALL